MSEALVQAPAGLQVSPHMPLSLRLDGRHCIPAHSTASLARKRETHACREDGAMKRDRTVCERLGPFRQRMRASNAPSHLQHPTRCQTHRSVKALRHAGSEHSLASGSSASSLVQSPQTSTAGSTINMQLAQNWK
eukprot:3237499-Rhodomonas_salina.1